MAKKIFIIVGEPSGDALGAKLITALKARAPEPLEITGIGGLKMESAGMKSLLPMDELCVMGLWEVVSHLPRLLKLIKGVVEEIEKRKPDIVITIDLPDFNFEVASRLKKRGISQAKIIHYVAPSVWAWRPGRAEKISKFLDGLICLFPFEPAHFPKLRAEFAGHPLIESNIGNGDGAVFRKKYGIPENAKTLGLFFGSRPAELKTMGGILKGVALNLKATYPDLHVIVPTLPSLEFEIIRIMENFDCPATVITNPDARVGAFAACDAAVAVSGTIALELAYAGIRHVIAYKAHPATWAVMKLIVKVKYAHLANILLNEKIVEEFLQGKARVDKITPAVLEFYKNPESANKMKEKSGKLRTLLGADSAQPPSARAADFVLSFLKK